MKYNKIKKNKHKTKGWIGTLIFHIILLTIFFITGLSYTIPPPPEEGITINFNSSESSSGNNSNNPEESSKNVESIIEKSDNVESTNQNHEKTISNNKKKDVKSPNENIENNPDDNIEEKITQEIEPKAVFNPNKFNKNGNGNNENYNGNGIDDNGDGGNGNGQNGDGEIGNRKKPSKHDYTLGLGPGYIEIDILVDANGSIIKIFDETFKTSFKFFSDYQKKELYKSIKEDLKYGPAKGDDMSDKRTRLKLNYVN
tara:strand:- start:1511 stop:2278 length:768 start_codon:yes stop_codon:yes gene_type:complete